MLLTSHTYILRKMLLSSVLCSRQFFKLLYEELVAPLYSSCLKTWLKTLGCKNGVLELIVQFCREQGTNC